MLATTRRYLTIALAWSLLAAAADTLRAQPPRFGTEGADSWTMSSPSEGHDSFLPRFPPPPWLPLSPLSGYATSDTLSVPAGFPMADLANFAAEEFPDLHQRLVRGMGAMSPEERNDIVFFLQRMRDLRDIDPPLYEIEKSICRMEAETQALGEAIRRQPENDATRRELLKAKLGDLFDLRGQRREMEAKRIEADLNRIRALLKQRKANRDAIIEKRLMELTSEGDGIDW